MFIGPQGDEYTSIQYAYEALQLEQNGSGNRVARGPALIAMSRILAEFKEGHSPEPTLTSLPSDEVANGVAKAAEWPKHYNKSFALSQLDDWLHRGEDDIVRYMSLNVYSIWVYRVDLTPFASNWKKHQASKPRHLDIPFDGTYVASHTWVQRIAVEPRIPRLEGFTFVNQSDPEMHYMNKSVLLRPISMPARDDIDETVEMRSLRAYVKLCTAPEGE